MVILGERQRRAVFALKELGGEIEYKTSGWPRVFAWIFPRDYLDEVKSVSLLDCDGIGRHDLWPLAQIPSMERLTLEVHFDVDLSYLANIQHLKELDLDRGASTGEIRQPGAELLYVSQLRELEELSIRSYGPHVDLSQLTKLTRLRVLRADRIGGHQLHKLRQSLPNVIIIMRSGVMRS